MRFINLKQVGRDSYIYLVNGTICDHKVAWMPCSNAEGKDLLMPVAYDGVIEHNAFIKRRIAVPIMVVTHVGGMIVNRTFGQTYVVPDLFQELILNRHITEFKEDFPNVRWAKEGERFVTPMFMTKNERTSISHKTISLRGLCLDPSLKIASTYLDAIDGEAYAKMCSVEIGNPWHELVDAFDKGRMRSRVPLENVTFDPASKTMPESVVEAIRKFKEEGNRLL